MNNEHNELLQARKNLELLKKKLSHAYQLYKHLEDRYEKAKQEYHALDRQAAFVDGRYRIIPTKASRPLPKTVSDPLRAAQDAFRLMSKAERDAMLLELEKIF